MPSIYAIVHFQQVFFLMIKPMRCCVPSDDMAILADIKSLRPGCLASRPRPRLPVGVTVTCRRSTLAALFNRRRLISTVMSSPFG